MCATCGCDHDHDHEHHGHDHHGHAHEHHAHDHEPPRRFEGGTEARTIRVERDLLAKNDAIAATNRARLRQRDVLALNLIGAPGAGKTALLEDTIRRFAGEVTTTVIEGDQATARDAERIRRAGSVALQVNTGTGCHLDAAMIESALTALDPPAGSVLFVENVGNLVCPALFDLGERAKVVVMSVTEGDDKPLKYPHVFRAAAAVVITKTDLLPHVDFDVDACVKNARQINGRIEAIRVSARQGDGMARWCAWVRRRAGVAVSPSSTTNPGD